MTIQFDHRWLVVNRPRLKYHFNFSYLSLVNATMSVRIMINRLAKFDWRLIELSPTTSTHIPSSLPTFDGMYSAATLCISYGLADCPSIRFDDNPPPNHRSLNIEFAPVPLTRLTSTETQPITPASTITHSYTFAQSPLRCTVSTDRHICVGFMHHHLKVSGEKFRCHDRRAREPTRWQLTHLFD